DELPDANRISEEHHFQHCQAPDVRPPRAPAFRALSSRSAAIRSSAFATVCPQRTEPVRIAVGMTFDRLDDRGVRFLAAQIAANRFPPEMAVAENPEIRVGHVR